MPLDALENKVEKGPFTDKHLADLKLLNTKLVEESVMCTFAWIYVSLESYNASIASHHYMRKEEMEHYLAQYSSEEGTSFLGMKTLESKLSARALASKLFARMKHLQQQMHEVERLMGAAQRINDDDDDVIW